MRILDLDDLGAEVRQEVRRHVSRHQARKVHDAHAGERRRRIGLVLTAVKLGYHAGSLPSLRRTGIARSSRSIEAPADALDDVAGTGLAVQIACQVLAAIGKSRGDSHLNRLCGRGERMIAVALVEPCQHRCCGKD